MNLGAGTGVGLARSITQAFFAQKLDLSSRAGVPTAGWEGLPEVAAARAISSLGASPAQLRAFLTLVTALDYSRDSDRLWAAASSLFARAPWAFDVSEISRRREEVAETLRASGVSQRHGRDSQAWMRIAEVVASGRDPEVSRAIEDGEGDAERLVRSLARVEHGVPLFPLLKGPKIGPMWIRILVFPGGARIANLDLLPVSVDVQVIRATHRLGKVDARGLSEAEARRVVQEAWRDDVRSVGAVGPEGLSDTCAALDPALWFWGKWGCSICEQRGEPLPIATPCHDFCSLRRSVGADGRERPSAQSSRASDVRSLIHEHLTAGMIMVALDAPVHPERTVADVLGYLDDNEFDLALVDLSDLVQVKREALRAVVAERPDDSVAAHSVGVDRDRLVERSLELGEVARRLHQDDSPLLVVGRSGPQYVITRADFTRPAGQAAALALLAALDGELDGIVKDAWAEAEPLLSEETRKRVGRLHDAARVRSEEVGGWSYLTLGERLEICRRLRLAERLDVDLGIEAEHARLTRVRNALAHGRDVHGAEVVEALAIAERVLDGLTRGRP